MGGPGPWVHAGGRLEVGFIYYILCIPMVPKNEKNMCRDMGRGGHPKQYYTGYDTLYIPGKYQVKYRKIPGKIPGT